MLMHHGRGGRLNMSDEEAKTQINEEAKTQINEEAKTQIDEEAKTQIDEEAKTQIDEEAKTPFPRLEFGLKALTTMTVVVGTIISVLSYTDARTKEAEARKAEAEARKQADESARQARVMEADARRFEALSAFRKLQLDRYTEIVTVASRLAAAKYETKADLNAATRRFYEMYWGDLSIVESEALKTAMANLRGALERQEEIAVRNWAYRISHLARTPLLASFDVSAAKLDLSKSPSQLTELIKQTMKETEESR
jgi:hypothetical protein